jgi:hypothetical protein
MLRKWTLAYRTVGKLPVPQWHETPCMHAYVFFSHPTIHSHMQLEVMKDRKNTIYCPLGIILGLNQRKQRGLGTNKKKQ